jgi:hypothetical protein
MPARSSRYITEHGAHRPVAGQVGDPGAATTIVLGESAFATAGFCDDELHAANTVAATTGTAIP